ncbi:WASH complex subunit 1 [Octopus bimaculoides]|uniref:WASH complex subunit 1 n=1 Tax=Octopus bimaculoides TaxID=37653 RepID=UPI00071C8977|nr:WASH complex subunit 1 [Octopus bimaculoides]|eukprot:XP_014790172.1 PREDICTED: WAS protein family homolog 1-like [Octopus bimaculoides]
MSNQIYNIPTIPPDLWQEDTIIQIADTLQYLYQVTDDIFDRISNKVNENLQRLAKVNDRVGIAQAKVEKLKGSNKATRVFASAKFPSTEYLDEYNSLFRDKQNLKSLKKTHSKLQGHKHTTVDEKVLKEKLQFYNVHINLKSKQREGEGEGLGRLPHNIPSISTLLLFNTSENLYKKYVMLDPLGVVTKTREDIGEEDGLTEAPSSIAKNEEIKRLEADTYFYVPSIGNVPEITAPTSLPDLPGVADDVSYMADLGPSIAPSVPSSMPDLPTIGESDSLDFDKPSVHLDPSSLL